MLRVFLVLNISFVFGKKNNMCWLDLLLDQIIRANNYDEVETATRDFLQPIADHIQNNIGDPEEQKKIINAWWQKEINAAIEINATRNKTILSNSKKFTENKNA